MQAVVLAAGEGTRMRPLSEDVPKPMLPVGGRPLAANAADAAIDAGVDELVFVVGYRGEAVREWFGGEYRGVPVRYEEQTEQAGTAHAVQAAAGTLDGPFMVLNGDNVYDAASIERLVEARPSVAAFRAENPSNYGVLSTEGDTVTGVFEKPSSPPSDLVNAGAYVFPEAATAWLKVPVSDRGEHELTDVLATAIDESEVTAVPVEEWLDVGRPWELLAANERRLAGLDGRVDGAVHETAHVGDAAVVEEGATVGAGAVVEGPVLVRADATVRANATVRGPAVVGAAAAVGEGAAVADSVLMRGVTVGSLATVRDSVVGPDARLGASTTVANRRHDGEPIRMNVKGEAVSTGRRRFGAVLGPDAETGADATLSPGVSLAAGAHTRPGETVLRDR